MKTARIRIMHYVPHADALDWLRLGWVVVRPNCSMTHHDHHAVTMEWLCDCNVTVRSRAAEAAEGPQERAA